MSDKKKPKDLHKDLLKDDEDFNPDLETSEDDDVEEVDEPDLGELAAHLEGVNRDFEASEDYDDEPNEVVPSEDEEEAR
jgi:hypothetical protein